MSRRNGQDLVPELLDLVYAAATEPQRWTDVLLALSRNWNTGVAALRAWDKRRTEARIQVMVGLTAEQAYTYNSHYGAIDSLWKASQRLTSPGQIVHRDDLVPFDIFRKSEFFYDYLARYELEEQMGCLLSRDEHSETALTFCRSSRLKAFGVKEEQLLQKLMPHIQRSISLHNQLLQSAHATASLSSALDLLPVGVILLNGRGEVISANIAAQRLFESRDGLFIQKRKLAAVSPAASKILEEAIANALSVNSARGSCTILLPRPEKSPLQIVAYATLQSCVRSMRPGVRRSYYSWQILKIHRSSASDYSARYLA